MPRVTSEFTSIQASRGEVTLPLEPKPVWSSLASAGTLLRFSIDKGDLASEDDDCLWSKGREVSGAR